MKHLLIALLTLALTLAFCVFACAQVRSEALTTLNTLRLAQIQAERQDYAAAADAVLSAGESWKAQERFFDIVLRHSEVDDVTTGFSLTVTVTRSWRWTGSARSRIRICLEASSVQEKQRFRG